VDEQFCKQVYQQSSTSHWLCALMEVLQTLVQPFLWILGQNH